MANLLIPRDGKSSGILIILSVILQQFRVDGGEHFSGFCNYSGYSDNCKKSKILSNFVDFVARLLSQHSCRHLHPTSFGTHCSTPRPLSRDKVARMLEPPQKCAGIRSEPPISEPVAKTAPPPPTIAPEPPELPPGERAVFWGFSVFPNTRLSVA